MIVGATAESATNSSGAVSAAWAGVANVVSVRRSAPASVCTLFVKIDMLSFSTPHTGRTAIFRAVIRATHLRDLGARVSGIDLSPEMIAIDRRTYPDLRFDVGSMTDLELPEAGLGGIVAWYSLFYVPPERQPDVLATFHRALAPGGVLL